MGRGASSGLFSVLAFGVVAFLVACLSILDMFLPRPYDGVVLDVDRADLTVAAVLPGSGAQAAGIRPGDKIDGVGREIVRHPRDVARVLQSGQIGAVVPYLIERDGKVLELNVRLGPRRLGTPLYLYACFLGLFFFVIGLYVLLRRPDLRPGAPAPVFFVLCTLFMVFLVCRLRPASYSWIDGVVLTTGTLSLLALPAAFLHFFLVFPRKVSLRLTPETSDGEARPAFLAVERFVNDSPRFFTVLYLLPPILYAAVLVAGSLLGVHITLVSGAPLPSWVLMGDYMVLGLLALLFSLLRAEEGRERRQIATVFGGTVLGITPFLVLGVVLPSLFRTDRYVLLGVVPLILVPLTFAYAIVRFQSFDIRVIVRRSLLYTVTTAVVAGVYGISIAGFNFVLRDASLGRSPYYPLLLALAIVALFDPLRQRLQGPVNRFFFREAYDARKALEDVSDALAREFSLDRLDTMLTTRLAEIMRLEWAALYVRDGDRLTSRTAVPPLPTAIRADLLVVGELAREAGPVRLATLEPLKVLDPASREFLDRIAARKTRLLAPLRTRAALHGMLLLGGKLSEEEFNRDDLQLIRTLANQGAVGLENSRLLAEKTRQAELEKELEIARRVQFSLIPERLPNPPGWKVAARCQPAQRVGGDFYDALPGVTGDGTAFVVGDVSGKSVSGAMLMVAAREVLHTASMGGLPPEELLQMANQRLYKPQPRLFVALAYVLLSTRGRVRYALAGQPPPIVRRLNGTLEELSLPHHRLPLGALQGGRWDLRTAELAAGELIVIYSDGVTEARNAAGDVFGEERLLSVLKAEGGDPEDLLDRLLEAVGLFVGGAEPYDDVTVIAARCIGDAEDATNTGTLT
jgi:serine phosphatase RsbU (regulator of sigma subunit)